MSATELNKPNAKIEKRWQELAKQEALLGMKAVAKRHGVDFAEVARSHGARRPKAPVKVAQKATTQTAPRATGKAERKATAKAASKEAAKTKQAVVNKAASKPTKTTKIVSKAKYKNLDNPEQTWSVKGRKPAWFTAHLDAGKALEDLAA
ncbi:H-NS family nucleoid-associated regulatory protein [uncultured Roseobacter sp.]|uniref:H-NS family nucleoid-associated regulatory protein n=1 Tax=uncultured Roseobacter sp. TaxID=114847 RepID=UPI00261E8D60|nr:H-NS family nucleoid-associated regulatory protein [uncultured Roseobacter sp.]